MADNVVEADRTTLSSFIMMQTKDPDLALLMTSMEIACKGIARAVRKAGIAGLFGMAGTKNATGDSVKKLDLLSNLLVINALKKSRVCAVLVSEEEPEPILMPESDAGRFCVAFDPLDGSSNIDCNVSTGTIFSIFEKTSPGPPKASDILRSGKDMVAAGYCMYGSATELVVTFRRGVERFILDPSLGEFIHIGSTMKIPKKGKKIYSCNEGNFTKWDKEIQEAVKNFKQDTDTSNNNNEKKKKKKKKKPYSLRYVGSMVSDVHRTMLYGGIFMYPADKKSKNGKLRILYEGFPMALLVEEAGGLATTGYFRGRIQRILDLTPVGIHERCPVILGCHRDVEPVLKRYENRIVSAERKSKL
uniref:Fructose-1,6-bisphosphatase, cytosolic n=3 Tax=Lotharella globosa TaxID=91324 RepID=A0A7S3YYF7_9EUKA